MSLIPVRLLYILSNIARFIVFDVIKYRKGIVYDNLRSSFPFKSEHRIVEIQREFEQAFCDQWIEVVKLMSMSAKKINEMVQADWSVLNSFSGSEQNVHVFLGHQFNWELANVACQINTKQQFYGIYLPLSSRPFDRLMKYIRMRTGSHLVNAQNLRSDMKQLYSDIHILGVIADQSSNNLESCYWYDFLQRPCPFTFVPEKTARLFKSAVVFASTHKLGRGRYRIEFKLISECAEKELPGSIMDQYVALLEESISRQPFNWLWSHKRWKKKLPADVPVRKKVSPEIH